MKQYILLLFLGYSFFANCFLGDHYSSLKDEKQIQVDRKLSDDEVKQRGLDLLATEIIEQIKEIDLRKMARSAIFETSYGFRWKMINLQTGNIIIMKVNKDFELISARNSKTIKRSSP